MHSLGINEVSKAHLDQNLLKIKQSDSGKKDIQRFDLEKIIASKNPQLLKWLPAFLLKYIKHIVHQDEINDFLIRTRNEYGYDFAVAAIKDFKIQLSSTGLENIPKSGGCIIVANHPLGGIDGIAVMREVGRIRKDMKALVNDILMNLKNLNSLLIPVNKHGKNPTECVSLIDKTFASDECIIVFPAGLVSRKQSGEIKDLVWKKSFISKAIKYKRNVIPVYIDAQNSSFFYNLASFRKMIGIKANIEMFYLIDETYKQTGKSIKLKFGSPISYLSFTPEKTDQYWAENVKDCVYGLKENNS